MKMIKRLLGLAASAALAFSFAAALPASAAANDSRMLLRIENSSKEGLSGLSVSVNTITDLATTSPEPVRSDTMGPRLNTSWVYQTNAQQYDQTKDYSVAGVTVSGTVTGRHVSNAGSVTNYPSPGVPLTNYSTTSAGWTPTATGFSMGEVPSMKGGAAFGDLELTPKNGTLRVQVDKGSMSDTEFNSAYDVVSIGYGTTSGGSALTPTGVGNIYEYAPGLVPADSFQNIYILTKGHGGTATPSNTVAGPVLGLPSLDSSAIQISHQGGGSSATTGLTVNLVRNNTTVPESVNVTIRNYASGGTVKTQPVYFAQGQSAVSTLFTGVTNGTYTVTVTNPTTGATLATNTATVSGGTGTLPLNIGGTAPTGYSTLSVTAYYNNGTNNTYIPAGSTISLRSGSVSGTTIASAIVGVNGVATFTASNFGSSYVTPGTYYVVADAYYNANTSYYSTVTVNADKTFGSSSVVIGQGGYYNGYGTVGSVTYNTLYANQTGTFTFTVNAPTTAGNMYNYGTYTIGLSSSSSEYKGLTSNSVTVNTTGTYSVSMTIPDRPYAYIWYTSPNQTWQYYGTASISNSSYNQENVTNNNVVNGFGASPTAIANGVNSGRTVSMGSLGSLKFSAKSAGRSVTTDDVNNVIGFLRTSSQTNKTSYATTAKDAAMKLINANKGSIASPFYIDGTNNPFNLDVIVTMNVSTNFKDAAGTPKLYRYNSSKGIVEEMTTQVQLSGNKASFAVNDASSYFLMKGITNKDLSAGEGATDSASDVVAETEAPETTTVAVTAVVTTVAPAPLPAPVETVATTVAASNPKTGNAPIALAFIPLAVAAACVIAKRTK